MKPDQYEPKVWGESQWLEHRVCFTTNPCRIPAWVLRSGWPKDPESEGSSASTYSQSDPNLRAAYRGTASSG